MLLTAAAVTAAKAAAAGLPSGLAASGSASEQQLDLRLSALRVHRQLLQAEIARLYMDTSFSPETPLLLEELQQRQHDVQLQIETLEGSRAHDQDAHNLALSLAADFEYLQHKLDELKQQLQQLDALQLHNNSSSSSSNNSNSKHPQEAQRDVANTTPPTASTGLSSYFWTPLLTMPEFPSGSIAQTTQSSPSLIKRLLAMLRPNSSASGSGASSSSGSGTGSSSGTSSSNFLRGQWPDASRKDTKVQLLSADELLPQLQLQRQFLDDAIKRLEHLANDNKV
ncbi:hypothetical protein KR222_006984 [Zaprionus bogoriensis]|nr:hypothetical protein KR222_006984 [Zaprionus bogoriensis]